jgi:uncharacterized protein (DUF1330 family)
MNTSRFKTFVGMTLALLLGVGIGVNLSLANASEAAKPAFVIVSGTVVDSDPAALTAYREKAGPLATAAGISVLARSEVLVLEGEWSHPKVVTVERFDSMQALKDFWYSDGYQEAKKLREGKFKADFIVAVEAI